MKRLKIGDSVIYRMWNGTMAKAKVVGIEICAVGEKYGKPVNGCDLDAHSNGVLDLDNQHWAYFDQVKHVIRQAK